MPRVAAIIPAYNEGKTIGSVLTAVRRSPLVDEIVVVSDGCTDNTVEVARRHGVVVIALPHNVGKGGAIAAGLAVTRAEVALLLDADLVGLMPEHVESLVRPVLRGEADMTIGQHGLMQEILPFFNGQRALRREVLESLSGLEDMGFGVEVALTRYAKDAGLRTRKVRLPNLTHVPKHKKHGRLRSVRQKIKAGWEIAKQANRVDVS
ncbi:MAG: glycosyltransferase family 2 protein [Armatimonadetes bacterium]|nr:glycosyltransferase family 2 protein [Armatimonadota bacterium]